MTTIHRFTALSAAALLGCSALAACGESDGTSAPAATNADAGATASPMTVTNCGKEKEFNAPVKKMFVNDGNIISIALAAGARDSIVAVSSLQRDEEVLKLKYGSDVDGLNVVAPKYPTLENVIAAQPEVMFAGWNYGFAEAKNLTPDLLAEKGIASYVLSESCRSGDGSKRGIMDPWEAVEADITNIGKLTGSGEKAEAAVKDLVARRKALQDAKQADDTPVAFLFDSARDSIFSSGSFGAPEAILTTAGATNALGDVEDTWTTVSWERLTTADPDIIFFVDYPSQTFAEKVEALKANPASKDLKAVKEERFVNLPYAMWTSGPLNIDAAEVVRKALEHFELQPSTDIEPGIDMTKLTTPGNTWLSE